MKNTKNAPSSTLSTTCVIYLVKDSLDLVVQIWIAKYKRFIFSIILFRFDYTIAQIWSFRFDYTISNINDFFLNLIHDRLDLMNDFFQNSFSTRSFIFVYMIVYFFKIIWYTIVYFFYMIVQIWLLQSKQFFSRFFIYDLLDLITLI